jgi:hypothetical protein
MKTKKDHRWSRQDWIINKTFPKCFLQVAYGKDYNSETDGALARVSECSVCESKYIFIEGQLFFRIWISSCFYIALVLQGTTRCKSTECLAASLYESSDVQIKNCPSLVSYLQKMYQLMYVLNVK